MKKTAQADGKVVHHAYMADQTIGKAAVVHPELDLCFHMVASDDDMFTPVWSARSLMRRPIGTLSLSR